MLGWLGERGGGARRLRPADEARGRPLGVRPMRVRHVGGLGGVLAAAPASAMRGDAPAFEKQFDRGGGEADLDPLMHELVGDAVVVVLDEDVVVDVHAGVAPLGEFIPTGREWAEQRTIELLEQRAAGDAELPSSATPQSFNAANCTRGATSTPSCRKPARRTSGRPCGGPIERPARPRPAGN